MNTPRKIIFFISILFSFTEGYANDGTFYASGNHLIPMYESDIIVKKEILTIKRIAGDKAVITVYYEFFNPKKSKELEVGFEAQSPAGDVQTSPVNGHHPYITKFTVNLNGEAVPFKVAIVDDSLYYKDGKYKSKTVAQAEKESEETGGEVNFFYVYHFRALFKEGLNILQHTYTIELSTSVVENYDLHYILTAAGRWGNRQIDDFTLQIDMGEFQDLTIPAYFFNDVSEWQLVGEGKSVKAKVQEENGAEFFIRKGMIVFQKKNFKPTGDLHFHSYKYYNYISTAELDDFKFDSKRDPLPFCIESQDGVPEPVNDLSKKIMKNLPFARRGYVFKSADLQNYFERQKWYVKNQAYKAELDKLTPVEQAWVHKY